MEAETNAPAGSAVTDVLAGLLNRRQLADQLGVTERTLIRREHVGLPVIRIGMTRLYDPAAVREWIVRHQSRHDVPKRGRPAKSAA